MPTVDANAIRILHEDENIEVVWVYGSRARGDFSETSDIDIALALSPDAMDDQAAVDDVQYRLSGIVDVPVSVVDINRVPVPLALNIITEGEVIKCKSDLRMRAEQQRVWSLWEEYKYRHEQNRSKI